jgi:hypothetical protein
VKTARNGLVGTENHDIGDHSGKYATWLRLDR